MESKFKGIIWTITEIEKRKHVKARIAYGTSTFCPIMRVFSNRVLEEVCRKYPDIQKVWRTGGNWWMFTLSSSSRIRYNYKIAEWLRNRVTK